MLVVDANVAYVASLAAEGLAMLRDPRLVAPALMWSEARSAIHEAVWRRELDREEGSAARSELDRLGIERIEDARLSATAWQIADELGVAKTYDAEYLAVARLLGVRVVTLDMRLRRGADRLGLVITPNELGA